MLHVAVITAVAAAVLAVLYARERRRATRAIRAGEARYRQLVDALPKTVVSTFDRDLRYTFVGGLGLDDVGWAADDYIGRTPSEHLQTPAGAELEENYRAVLAGEQRAIDYRSVRNGRPYWLGAVPMRDADGAITGGLVVMHDVSDQHAAAQALAESEEALRTVVAALEEGIAVHAADGTTLLRNASAKRLLDLGDTHPGLDAPSWKLVGEDGEVLTVAEYPASRALATGEPQLCQVAGLCLANGDTRWLSINAVPLERPGDDAPYAVVVSFTDVSARKEAERVKDEFFALVSHELRTPLTSIAGYVEMLLDEEDPLTEEQRRFLIVVARNSGRLQRLVGDLLFVAQLEAGRLSFDLADVELGDVVADGVETARGHAERGRVELHARVDPAGVAGDSDRLGQVVDNLLSNAVKFTPPNGRIDVELIAAGDAALLVVRDTGVGIPADEIDGLFGKFFRSSTATDQEIPGVGLGLSICKAIVEGHGGTIAIESGAGEGTVVRVTLPATPSAIAVR